jgi:FMN-dependent NADH-azoreductase
VAETFRAAWAAQHPAGAVTTVDLAVAPLPHLIAAVQAAGTPEGERTADQRAALAVQVQVLEQFLAADEYLMSLPMYNWGIPSQLKAYLDHLLLVKTTLMADGSPSPVAGRPATVVVSFGGGYGPARRRPTGTSSGRTSPRCSWTPSPSRSSSCPSS